MKRWEERSRGWVAFVAAGLLHLAAPWLLHALAPAGAPLASASAETDPTSELEVETVPDETPAPMPPPEERAERDERSERREIEAAVALAMRELTPRGSPEAPSARVDVEPRDAPEGASRETSPAPMPPGSAWAFRPTVPNVAPGAVQILAASGGRVDAEMPSQVSTTGGLVESLDSADVDRGLGRGGPVRSAVELAARTENAPVRGSATFSVTIFSDGKIDVQVASNQTDWSHLVPAIREAVKKSQVRLHPKSRGLNVVVAVEAKVKYPDGYAPPEDGAKVTVTPSLDRDLPMVDIHAQGKRCWARMAVTPGGIGVGADCAVGNMARGVSTRIVRETRL